MNQGTKQRVVGTVVLLALALIFLPIIFDGEGSYQRKKSSRIPDPPEMRVMPDPIPERPVIQAENAATLTANQAATRAPPEPINPPATAVTDSDPLAVVDQTAPSTPPGLDESGLPIGWSVRLGSFSNANNAENLTQRLLAGGYRAYTREITSTQGLLTAVFVGPQIERNRADQLKQQLQTEFQLSGIVVRFELDSI